MPDGVVARMQLSPNRIQLAGIQTAPVSFRPLAIEYERGTLVTIEQGAPIAVVEIPLRHAAWISAGQLVELTLPDLPGRDALTGHVLRVASETSGGWAHLRAPWSTSQHRQRKFALACP